MDNKTVSAKEEQNRLYMVLVNKLEYLIDKYKNALPMPLIYAAFLYIAAKMISTFSPDDKTIAENIVNMGKSVERMVERMKAEKGKK
jgi:hypothetical protein